jgi:hypothetical protein
VQKRKDRPAKGGLFLRENSSNGGLNRQNFLAKSYEPKKGGVKDFLGNNSFYYQQLTECVNSDIILRILRQKRSFIANPPE